MNRGKLYDVVTGSKVAKERDFEKIESPETSFPRSVTMCTLVNNFMKQLLVNISVR